MVEGCIAASLEQDRITLAGWDVAILSLVRPARCPNHEELLSVRERERERERES